MPHTIADHLHGPCRGSPGPGGVKVPVLSMLGKSPSRNLLFAADAEEEHEKLYFFPQGLVWGYLGAIQKLKDYVTHIAGHF